MIDLYVADETSPLEEVILGTPDNFGDTPALEKAYDPKSKEHISNGTFPSQSDIIREMNSFCDVFLKHGVTVHRPTDIPDLNQVFARDIGFVVDDTFVIPNIIEDRKKELEGVGALLDCIKRGKHLNTPENARIEGGDVLLAGDRIYVGYSGKADFRSFQVARTNEAGVKFLKENFRTKEVIPVELRKSDTVANENALHLDCCFQPVGYDMAIVHPESFKNPRDLDLVISRYPKENVFKVTKEEMYEMNCNVFSIDPVTVVSDLSFERLNEWLTEKGFTLELIKYREIAKMEGLFRCSTLPLRRKSLR